MSSKSSRFDDRPIKTRILSININKAFKETIGDAIVSQPSPFVFNEHYSANDVRFFYINEFNYQKTLGISPTIYVSMPALKRTSKSKKSLMNINPTQILDYVDQYIFCKNTEGVYTYSNEPFARVLGLSCKDAVIGKTDYELAWQKEQKMVAEKEKEVLLGNSIYHSKERPMLATGLSEILITRVPHRSVDGQIDGLVGSFFYCENHLILEATGTFDKEKHRLHLEYVPEWLSSSEVRVCFYLIHGFSAAGISEKIGTAVSTVRFHIDNIKQKMQCSNKNEVIEVAMRTGIAWKIFNLQHLNEK